MNYEPRQEMMRRQSAGMRAMSKEEMARRQSDAANGARMWPAGVDNMRGQAAMTNLLLEVMVAMPVVQAGPKPPTRWQRFRQWWRAFFKDGSDGGM